MKPLTLLLILCMHLNAEGQTKPEENSLFNAFKQGSVNGGGNCASIALIKASIGTFGLGNVFTYTHNSQDSSITVTLKNDSTFTVTYKQIREATKENGFVSKLQTAQAKATRKYADTCFAVMVKMNEILWEYDSYTESLTALLNGYNTPSVYRLLGVRFKEIPVAQVGEQANIVTYNSYHAVYSSYGYYDETKSTKGFSANSSFKNNRFGPKCILYGCKFRKAFSIE